MKASNRLLKGESPRLCHTLVAEGALRPGAAEINENAQVIDCHHQPIPHLFAAGKACGNIHGAGRLSSRAFTE
jgi:predicted oxidoreductase